MCFQPPQLMRLASTLLRRAPRALHPGTVIQRRWRRAPGVPSWPCSPAPRVHLFRAGQMGLTRPQCNQPSTNCIRHHQRGLLLLVTPATKRTPFRSRLDQRHAPSNVEGLAGESNRKRGRYRRRCEKSLGGNVVCASSQGKSALAERELAKGKGGTVASTRKEETDNRRTFGYGTPRR